MVSMRKLIEAVEAANASPLDATLQRIADYILHNAPNEHMREDAATLHAHGYAEVVTQTTFFRALSHDITDQDRARFETIGALFKAIRAEPRMLMNQEPQGFTTSLESALEFVHGNEYYTHHQPHYDRLPLTERAHSIWVVYEVQAPRESILFSMRGLDRLLDTLPPSTATKALHTALHDVQFGYLSDDEVVLDFGPQCRIVGLSLYDSRQG